MNRLVHEHPEKGLSFLKYVTITAIHLDLASSFHLLESSEGPDYVAGVNT